MNVALQAFAYDEPADSFSTTLEAIREQPVPEEANVSYEAWITPTGSDDTSATLAESTGFSAFAAGKGKITARNEAHSHAVEDGADIIIAWDADAPPLSDGSLSQLLEPFGDSSVVAVNSLPVARRTPDRSPSIIGTAVDLGGLVEDIAIPHVHGQCSAFRGSAWQEVGPFDESIDQTDVVEMRAEEEIGFYRRLRRVGNVAFAPAPVYNNPRRHLCNIPGMGDTDYCNTRGVETFQHRQDES